MSLLGRRNIPPKSYGVRREKPKLRKQVQEVLTNKYGQVLPKEDDTTIDTYYILSKDSYYQGSWLAGLPHGPGIAIYPDGSYYKGNFDCGQAQDPKGYLILPNGAQYQGNIVKSKIHGKGRLVHRRPDYTYQGEWSEGKPHGRGIEKIEKLDKSAKIEKMENYRYYYDGFFQNGLKHCFDKDRTIQEKKEVKPNRVATYIHEGDVYVGEFKNGSMHGYGELTNTSNNLQYKGEFIKGKKQGYGSLTTSKGTLTGHFMNDVIDGEGEFVWSQDGKRYKGYFKNSKFDGIGTIIFPQGNSLTGLWKEGQSQSLKAVYDSSLKDTILQSSNYGTIKQSNINANNGSMIQGSNIGNYGATMQGSNIGNNGVAVQGSNLNNNRSMLA